MKPNFQVLLILSLYVYLLFSSSASARLLLPKQGEERVNAIGSTHAHAGPFVEIKQDDLLELMGLEKCEDKDEECLMRRMVAEAHLDYIYTQHHKP